VDDDDGKWWWEVVECKRWRKRGVVVVNIM
jgi:hypothetical protein